tara:strand:+ start:1779 stop:2207 length:429 start_codon:yes stop_codon:yes gene_type:complete
MEWILLAVGLIVGAGTGTGITWNIMKNRAPEVKVVETNKVVEKMVEVDSSLTETDLLKVPCSADYMEKNGEALCREMFCRMNTRSGNSSNAATAKECEAISNTINKAYIQEQCTKAAKGMDLEAGEFDKHRKACIEFFDRRL